jgi:hypothetical protein
LPNSNEVIERRRVAAPAMVVEAGDGICGRGKTMSEIHETIEKAHEGALVEGFNRRIALVIAVLALFLSFSETLGKSVQTDAIDANVKSSDTWAFFQAKELTLSRTLLESVSLKTKIIRPPIVNGFVGTESGCKRDCGWSAR